MLNCHDTTRLVSDSRERPLKLMEKFQLRIHLMMCDGCRNFESQMEVLSRALSEFARGRNEIDVDAGSVDSSGSDP